MIFVKRRKSGYRIDPDEIFLDSSNLPKFDTHQFEGRLEKPIAKGSLFILWFFFFGAVVLFLVRLADLELQKGAVFRVRAENNRLNEVPIFAERGAIFDRNGIPLAWNAPFPDEPFAARVYSSMEGLAHALGYVSYPLRDANGFYYKKEYEGVDGVERAYDRVLGGVNGAILIETNATGEVEGESVTTAARDGDNVMLAIDARVEEQLFGGIRSLAESRGFTGGAGVIMDVHTGEILALASFPEYAPQSLTDGGSAAIGEFLSDKGKPFLSRATAGLYAPGSIVKPLLAVAALQEQLIAPDEKILSTGSLSIPNPYDPGKESVFRDWKAHGWVDMRDALAVSSDIYFYEIGGGLPLNPAHAGEAGYEERKGLGIGKIETYMKLFGLGLKTGIDFPHEETGLIPTPRWKEKVFEEDWRLGDTYNTSIGQYGFQVTPLQAARAVAAIANGGKLVKPRLVKKLFSAADIAAEGAETPMKWTELPLEPSSYQVVREGMRRAVESGTASGLNIPAVSVAAKTGTAEIGAAKKYVHSWVMGFFPYENPRYAFAIVLERGPSDNLVGALFVFRGVLEWMAENTPEYLK